MPSDEIRRRKYCGSTSFVRFTTILLASAMISAYLAGCSRDPGHKAPDLAGTFSGVLPDGKHMTITLHQDENIVSGHGMVDSKSFSVSGVTSAYGPLVVAFENGYVARSKVVLSQRGRSAQLAWLGKTVALQRGGDPIPASSGEFAGEYATNKPYPIQITLTQREKMLAGTGYITDKAVALVGMVEDGTECANGTIQYSDASSARTRVCLSPDRDALLLNEADRSGGQITLRKREQ